MLTKLMMILSTATFGACGPVDLPKPATGGPKSGCPQYEVLLEAFNPGWDVKKMSRIMWRESNCQPEIRSRTRDTGLMQINDVNHEYLSRRWGVEITLDALKNPTINVMAAAELFRYWNRQGNGYQPWKATR